MPWQSLFRGRSMNTVKAEYKTDIAMLAADNARRDAEHAKRQRDNLRWQAGLWTAAVVLLGALIRWPG